MKKKIVSLALAIAMCFSLLTFTVPMASAVDGSDYIYTPEPARNVSIRNQFALILNARFGVNYFKLENVLNDFYFNDIVGEVSMEQLKEAQRIYNTGILSWVSRVIELYPACVIEKWFSFAAITEDVGNGIYRLVDDRTNEFITDINGDFPFVRITGDTEGVTQDPSVEPKNKWVRLDNLSNLPGVVLLSETELARTVAELNLRGADCSMYGSGDFYFIKKDKQSFYANFAGKPYVATRGPSAADTVRPPVTEDNVVIENNSGLVIDKAEGVLNLIGQLGDQYQLNIDNLEFDFGTNSYTVNAYTTVNEGDNYYYTYYTYNVQYNITNTYITYIGSNDAYEREEYELYYQLPDGRSSADLTAEEVAGMSFEFYDIVNYARSTDNVSVRGLYHFDGNIEDSSYFTGQGSFVWNNGASITFMESPSPFEGNLYLDNTAHSFDIVLPANIGSNDFQVQFRHYQASEIDTQDNIENRLVFGDAVLSWDESSLYFQGSKVADLPIGTWHEIALTRYNGTFYAYLNGLLVGTGSNSSYSFSSLKFEFGSTSRAYTMLDELRVLNICQIEGAEYYSPTVVPYDSNLVLVLPDEKLPIADSYYQVTPDPDALYTWDWSGLSYGDAIPADFKNYGSYGSRFTTGYWHYNSGDVLPINGGLTFDTGDFYTLWNAATGTSLMTTGIAIPMSGLLSSNTNYTVTVVLTDGSKLSHSFNSGSIVLHSPQKPYDYQNSVGISHTVGNVAKITTGQIAASWRDSANRAYCLFTSVILLTPAVSGGTFDVAYIEIAEGVETDLKVEEVTSVYSGIDLKPNTAAIQTVIPVNGYTVGGIRPSMPNRGDCWFPVMNNRITSVQIYTGTHWEEVNARWWTGSRWIPIYAFDINTLEDLFDIADGDSTVPLLPDQNAFLRWWQLQWLDFRSWLDGRLSELIAAVGGGGEGIDTETPDDDGNVKFSPLQLIDTILGGLLEIAKEVIVEFVSLVVDLFKMFIQALLDFVGGFVDVLSSGLTHFSTLSDGLSGIGNFVSGTYDAIPDDIQGVLTSSFVVIISVSLLAFLL